MQDFQRNFINVCLQSAVLMFGGDFQLKSGKMTPYFFDMGKLSSVEALAEIGRCYARLLFEDEGVDDYDEQFPTLLGPPDKGTVLAHETAHVLLTDYGIKDARFASYRKDLKTYGEKSLFLWAHIGYGTRVVIVDDVISYGETVRHAVELVRSHEAYVERILVGLDRRERGSGDRSVLEELSRSLDVPIQSIITIGNLMEYIREVPEYQVHLPGFEAYQREHCVL